MKKRVGLYIVAVLLFPQTSIAAMETGSVRTFILSALSLTNLTDLDFGSAPQGDPALTISAVSAAAATFAISGEPGSSYSIFLPVSATMTKTGGVIIVSAINSSPSGTGVLGAAGTQVLRIGGTRNNLQSNQPRGSYIGTFLVTVVY